jgi:transcriptional regulator with XRE-family HTH domain
MNDNSYNKWTSMTDKALIAKMGEFIQHHRLNKNKTQDDVAGDADMSRSTLSLLERGEKVSLTSLIKVLRVLDLLSIMNAFEVEREISPIQYAKLQKNKKQRASKKNKSSGIDEKSGW